MGRWSELKQMWVRINGILGKQAKRVDSGTLQADNGEIVSRSKGTREVLGEHNRKLAAPKLNKTFDTKFEKKNQRVGRGKYKGVKTIVGG